MWELARKPSTLPVAPKAVDAALLHELIGDRHALHGWAVAMVPRCQYLQRAVARGTWFSRRELSTAQRQARTILRAACAHRSLGNETLAAMDRLTAFVSGIDMTVTPQAGAA